MGLGLVVIAAAEAASRGAGQDEVAALARDASARSQCFTLFETLEYLQKGGRIGKAQALMGSILKIKPMIILRDGEPHPLGKARTFPKALVNHEGDSAGVRANRVPGGDAQHHSGDRAQRWRKTSGTCCRRGAVTPTSPASVRCSESTQVPGAIGIALLQAGGGGALTRDDHFACPATVNGTWLAICPGVWIDFAHCPSVGSSAGFNPHRYSRNRLHSSID